MSASRIDHRLVRTITRGLAALTALAVAALLHGCAKQPASSEAVLWVPGGARTPLRGGFESAALCADGRAAWIAYTEADGGGGARVHVRRTDDASAAPDAREPALVATFSGHTPGIALDADAAPVVVYVARAAAGGPSALVAVRGRTDGSSWSDPQIVLRDRAFVAAANRLVHTRNGRWLLPLLVDATPACLESNDGRTWTGRALHGWPRGGRAPAIVETADGTLLGFVAHDHVLARATSADGGTTWSAFEPLVNDEAMDVGIDFAAAAAADGALLAWTSAPPDSGMSPPGVWTLRLARTSTASLIEPLSPLARRAGEVTATPALCRFGSDAALAWFTAHGTGAAATAVCMRLVPETRRAGVADPHIAATAALDLWTQHVLGRPAPAQRLFIEGYFMRGLAAAHAVLPGAARPLAADTERGILQARSFADWMRSGQDANGYWPLGYRALYVADMAAVIGVYAAIAPHVDAATRRQWTESAQRFVTALERDGMLLPNGACGAGWMDTRERDEDRVLRAPYLVSTALAGIASHAWLYAQTREPEYARRARQSLDYTLAALQPDGSLPPFVSGDIREGQYIAAAYVTEGWMAADRYLDDPAVLETLRRALPAHVAWLVRTQNADGTWGDAADGETARAVAIPNFLIWYDRRCESRPEVHEALRRAGAALVDPDRWYEAGLLRPGKNEDVLRALAGRTLAAIASGEPVY